MSKSRLCYCLFCAGLAEKGELFACGEMDHGKLGCDVDADIDHFSPQSVNILNRVISVSCGHNHTVALTGHCLSFSLCVGHFHFYLGLVAPTILK